VIWRIASKEFTEIIRDGRFVWTSLILIVLFLVAMATGAQRYSIDRNMRAAATTEERGDWLGQGAQNPHTAAHHGVYAFKPNTPLALFDPGYDDYTGTLQYLEAHVENRASFPPAADGTSLQRFGVLSGATVLQLLTPLLIFLLTYAMIAGEREDGTLRQVLSVGVPRPTLIAGKALGALMGLGVVLLPAALIGGVAAALTAGHAEAHDLVDLPAKDRGACSRLRRVLRDAYLPLAFGIDVVAVVRDCSHRSDRVLDYHRVADPAGRRGTQSRDLPYAVVI
jgi:ABC-2 type transport system permease protein